MEALKGGVLVTGGTRGIGAACVHALSTAGFVVFAGYRGEPPPHDAAVDRVVPVPLEVTDEDSIRAARLTIENRFGLNGLAGLINNAGVVAAGPVETVPLDTFRSVMEVKCFGAIAVTQEFLPLLRRGRGRVVMMSSLSGRIATSFLGPYAASKFALEAVSDCLRRERPELGVPVTVVEPGPVATAIWDQVESMDPTPGGTLYAAAIRRRRDEARVTAKNGLPPESVARTVVRAMTAATPPSRVVVARGGWKARIARHLPDRLLDRLAG